MNESRTPVAHSAPPSRTPAVEIVAPDDRAHGKPGPEAPPSTRVRRQFVNFAFHLMDPEWRRLPDAEREEGKREAEAACEAFEKEGGLLVPYSLVGIRGDCELMLWRIHAEMEAFQRHTAALLSTRLGKYLRTPYSLLGMTKRSLYVDRIHPGHDDERMFVVPGRYKYLFVYPFVKTRAWYALDHATRQRMMDGHIRMGTTYPSVKLNTTYSFGLDDQEFVVAFESDRPDDFLDLVMNMRETEASSYTLRDTPTFTCLRSPSVRAMLDTLG